MSDLTDEERKEKMLAPGYIPMREDVEWWINKYGSWGQVPTAHPCEICGYHIIPHWNMGKYRDDCPVNHAELIQRLRADIQAALNHNQRIRRTDL